jgi:PilZ domain
LTDWQSFLAPSPARRNRTLSLKSASQRADPWEKAVSRIWDALKEAEREKSHSHPRERTARSTKSSTERRKSKRKQESIPLLVYGSDSEKQPFHEEAETLEVNEHGCLLSMESEVARGQRLFLSNMSNEEEQECHVVHVGRRVRGRAKVGLEFLRPAPGFWRKS